MRRLNLIIVLVLLAVPAAASAKVGVELEKDPQTLAPGERSDMIVMLMSEPRDPNGTPQPIVGVRPLVTFRNAKTGDLVRVRAGRTGRDGLARASVAFPSRGEWSVRLSPVKGLLHEPGQSLPVGIDAPGDDPLPPEVMEAPSSSAPAIDGRRTTAFPAIPLAVGLVAVGLAAAAFRTRKERPA